jgi:WD40 repeat protein
VLRGLSPKAQVRAVATTADGRVIAAVGGWYVPQPNAPPTEDGQLAIWRNGTLVAKPLRFHHAFGNAVALSLDGSTTAAVTDDGRVLVVDARTGRLERTIRPKNASGSVASVAFSPEGTLASGTWSGIVDLWNPKTGQSIGHPTLVAPAPVASISFSPDGRTFATSGGSSGGTRIWVTATQQQLGADFPGGAGQWGSVAYTPDGRYLISVFGDGTAYRWSVSLAAWENQACRVAGRRFTREEWQRFVGGRSYSVICPQFPAGP